MVNVRCLGFPAHLTPTGRAVARSRRSCPAQRPEPWAAAARALDTAWLSARRALTSSRIPCSTSSGAAGAASGAPPAKRPSRICPHALGIEPCALLSSASQTRSQGLRRQRWQRHARPARRTMFGLTVPLLLNVLAAHAGKDLANYSGPWIF